MESFNQAIGFRELGVVLRSWMPHIFARLWKNWD
jgi:hypothetical protein